jgi:hypothetical protein
MAFVLAACVRTPLPGLAISNGLFPGLAGVVKTLADEHGVDHAVGTRLGELRRTLATPSSVFGLARTRRPAAPVPV